MTGLWISNISHWPFLFFFFPMNRTRAFLFFPIYRTRVHGRKKARHVHNSRCWFNGGVLWEIISALEVAALLKIVKQFTWHFRSCLVLRSVLLTHLIPHTDRFSWMSTVWTNNWNGCGKMPGLLKSYILSYCLHMILVKNNNKINKIYPLFCLLAWTQCWTTGA